MAFFRLMHTHYDNLKVSRDAPPEVIRAAYKSLSQKYHPDRHADSEEANRVMRLLNAAYEVLRDPQRRAEHDQWIAAQEKMEAEQKQRRAQAQRAATAAQAQAQRQQAASRPAPQPTARDAERQSEPAPRKPKGQRARPGKTGPATPLPKYGSYALYAGIGAVIVVMLGDWSGISPGAGDGNAPQFAKPAQASTVQALARTVASGAIPATTTATATRDRQYARPVLTPRGLPWPTRSGYLPGYPVLNGGGLSRLTVDNSGSASDVLLKLVAMEGSTPLPVRTSFVRGGSTFTMENIAPGTYDLRYQSLDTGEIFRSERFELAEVREAGGTSASRNIFSLYAVPGGMSRSMAITEREFP